MSSASPSCCAAQASTWPSPRNPWRGPASPGPRALVGVTRSEDDWLLLQGLTEIPDSLLVAVLVRPDIAMYRRALDRIGALAAIGWNAQPADLERAPIGEPHRVSWRLG
jgi:hypothetical protein